MASDLGRTERSTSPVATPDFDSDGGYVPVTAWRRVRAGEVWTDNLTEVTHPTRIIVRRVARDGSWADIRVEQHSAARWGKRMRLPFPSAWRRLR